MVSNAMFERIRSLCRQFLGGGSDSPATDRPEDERRIWVRYPSTAEAVVKPMSNGVNTRLSARVRNVSRGGIGLLVNKEFRPGEMISLELPRSSEEETSTVLACVIHVNPAGEKQWSLGCTFSEELDEESLTAFGARKEKPSKPENRAWKRFGCQVQATCTLVSTPGAPGWPAQVVNISAGGIGLEVTQPVESGALLSLNLSSLGGTGARTILACVVHVISRTSGEWVLGCNFIHELSEADLNALL
jgi:hypothetical protein